MKDKAGSTVSIADNYDAIEKFCVGKTIKELEDVANSENPVDAVSGATLVDTKGYLEAIIEVAKKIN